MATIYLRRPPMALVHEIVPKNRARSFSIIHSIPNEHFGGAVQLSADVEPLECRAPWSSMGEPNVQIGSWVDKVEKNSKEHQLLDLDVNVHDKSLNNSRPIKKGVITPEAEMQRRRKIGLANKGNVPWNKGRQHSQETRERIRRRTIEALRNPKVKKRMSVSPCCHSEQSKARISFALRKLWEKRLKHKRLQAKCYWTWAWAVAEAARKGDRDQQELEWDSYEKMNSDILLQHLQWKTDRARQKEIAKRRAERAAKAKADSMARHAQERTEAQRVKAKKSKGTLKQPAEKKNILSISADPKLRARLAKILHRQQFEGHMCIRGEAEVEVQATAAKMGFRVYREGENA